MGTLNDQRKKQLEILRKTYTWLAEAEDIEEETLEILDRCRVSAWNSCCFTEGHCMDPSNEQCAYKLSHVKEG